MKSTLDLARLKSLAGRFTAEFAIVVLGVTVALWADGWVSEREDRAREIARLRAILDNVEDVLRDLREEKDNAEGASDALLQALYPDESDPRETGDMLLYGLFYGPELSPELNAYDDLKNSGELAALTNDELRRYLATMDTRLEQLELAHADLAMVQQVNFDLYAVDNLDMLPLYRNMPGIRPVSGRIDPEVLNDLRLRNRLLLKLDLVTQLINGIERVSSSMRDVRRTIEGELEGEID